MPADERNQKRIEDLERRFRSRAGDRELLLQLVDLYAAAGRYQQIAAILEGRVLAGEDDWDILRRCCDAFRLLNQPARGLELLDAHSAANSDLAAFWSLHGRMHEDLGSYDQARADHERAISLDADEPEHRYRLGVALMKSGRWDEGILTFETCVKLDPRMTKAQINIGCIHDQAGEHQMAVLAFQKAIEMHPDSVEAHCNLGAAYADMGRKRDAIEEFGKAIEIDPDYADAHFNLGLIYLEDRPEEALACLKHALDLDSQNWEVEYYLGVLHFKKGIYETAIRYLQRCRDRNADSAKVLYHLGMAYNKSDMPDHAIEVLTRLCEIEPGNPNAHFNLGIALDKKGLYDRAKDAYRAADRLGTS
jgi:tetratricopeptide (TPR) repeat protein